MMRDVVVIDATNGETVADILAAAQAADAARPEPEPHPAEPLLIPEAALGSGVEAIELRRAVATGALRSHRTDSGRLVVFRGWLRDWLDATAVTAGPDAA